MEISSKAADSISALVICCAEELAFRCGGTALAWAASRSTEGRHRHGISNRNPRHGSRRAEPGLFVPRSGVSPAPTFTGGGDRRNLPAGAAQRRRSGMDPSHSLRRRPARGACASTPLRRRARRCRCMACPSACNCSGYRFRTRACCNSRGTFMTRSAARGSDETSAVSSDATIRNFRMAGLPAKQRTPMAGVRSGPRFRRAWS